MKSVFTFIIALSFLTAGCSSSVVTPGDTIRSALPEKTCTLEDAWPAAGSNLVALGCPVNPETYTAVYGISGSGIMIIDVKSFDFNAIAAVIDEDGNLLAFNDDWKESTSARVVLEYPPSGAKLLVFSPDDSRGLYDITVEEGTSDDFEAFVDATDFADGSLTGSIGRGGYNNYLENILKNALENDVYINNYSQAKLFPFTVDSETLVSISLESDEFDPFLILMSIEDGTYRFVDFNDDYNGSYSQINRELDAGDYMALVMSYSEGSYGRFTLKMESIDEEALEIVEVFAQQQGIDYTGEIIADVNLAIAWWPGITETWNAPEFLNPFAPVAGFTFTVDNTSVYEINASGEMDVCLTVLRRVADSIQYVASNDDYVDLGSNARVIEPLISGDYIAVISPYSYLTEGEVSFSWSEDDAGISLLRSGRSTEIYVPYEIDKVTYRLNLQAGTKYSVSVESEELDPVITLVMPDGEILFDDDGGNDTNSLLNFTANEAQEGECFLTVEKYSSGEGTFRVLFETIDR